MQLPVGILIYWIARYDENQAALSGIWYYQEMGLPDSVEEKKQSLNHLKTGRSTTLTIHGQFDQLLDLLGFTDRFLAAGPSQIDQYRLLRDQLSAYPLQKTWLFDDIQNLKGSSLALDTVIRVEETIEEIKTQLKAGKGVSVNLPENWSLSADLAKTI